MKPIHLNAKERRDILLSIILRTHKEDKPICTYVIADAKAQYFRDEFKTKTSIPIEVVAMLRRKLDRNYTFQIYILHLFIVHSLIEISIDYRSMDKLKKKKKKNT